MKSVNITRSALFSVLVLVSVNIYGQKDTNSVYSPERETKSTIYGYFDNLNRFLEQTDIDYQGNLPDLFTDTTAIQWDFRYITESDTNPVSSPLSEYLRVLWNCKDSCCKSIKYYCDLVSIFPKDSTAKIMVEWIKKDSSKRGYTCTAKFFLQENGKNPKIRGIKFDDFKDTVIVTRQDTSIITPRKTSWGWSLIPGARQIKKGYIGEGLVTMIGEVALVVGGGRCYFMAQDKLGILKKGNLTLDDFNAASKSYETLRTVSYCLWGAAGALYIWNLFRASFMKPKNSTAVAWEPSLISSHNMVAPSLSLTFRF